MPHKVFIAARIRHAAVGMPLLGGSAARGRGECIEPSPCVPVRATLHLGASERGRVRQNACTALGQDGMSPHFSTFFVLSFKKS